MTKIYVTKFALTSGVFSIDAEVNTEAKSARFIDANGYRWFVFGKEFWLTPEDAIEDCERRKTSKLKSLEKQKRKIEQLNFNLIKGNL